jgi:hypothetical protein
MTEEQKAQAIKLRSEGMPYLKIAAKICASESGTYKFLIGLTKPPKPKPTPLIEKPKPKPALLLPPHILNSSCPTRKFNALYQDLQPQTKSEMYATLATAWRNTARLASR